MFQFQTVLITKIIWQLIDVIVYLKPILYAQNVDANRIRIAAHCIAQIIDVCSEKLSIHFEIVIVGNHSELFRVAGKVLSIPNASLSIQTIPVNSNNTDEYFPTSFSQIFLFNYVYSMREPVAYSQDTFYNKIVLIDFCYYRDFERNVQFCENFTLRHYRFSLFHHCDKNLMLIKTVYFSQEHSCKPKHKVAQSCQ